MTTDGAGAAKDGRSPSGGGCDGRPDPSTAACEAPTASLRRVALTLLAAAEDRNVAWDVATRIRARRAATETLAQVAERDGP